ANVGVGGLRLPIVAVLGLLGGSLVAGAVAALVQGYRVKPDELRLETPYLARSIAFTRYGFGLDRITVTPFPPTGPPSPPVPASLPRRCGPQTPPPPKPSAGGTRVRSSTPTASCRSCGCTTTSTMSTSTAIPSTAPISRSCWRRASSIRLGCRRTPRRGSTST